jgi:hypothetical protein
MIAKTLGEEEDVRVALRVRTTTGGSWLGCGLRGGGATAAAAARSLRLGHRARQIEIFILGRRNLMVGVGEVELLVGSSRRCCGGNVVGGRVGCAARGHRCGRFCWCCAGLGCGTVEGRLRALKSGGRRPFVAIVWLDLAGVDAGVAFASSDQPRFVRRWSRRS